MEAGLRRLEERGEKTERQLSNIGDGADKGAKKVESSATRIVKSLSAVERKGKDVSNQPVSLKMDLKGEKEVIQGLEAIRTRRDSLDRGKISLSTDLKGASKVIGELNGLEGVSTRIDGDKILLTADVDGTEAGKAGLLSLQSVASRIDGDKLRMKVDVDGAPQAIGELAAINQVADKVDGRNVNLKTGSGVSALEALGSAIDGVATRMRSLQQVGSAAIIPGFVAAIGAIPAIVTPALSALYALGGAMGSGLAGAVTIGGTALGGMVTGLVGYVGAVTSAVSGARNVADELENQKLATQGAALAVTDAKNALNQAKPGTLEYKNAQLALAEATKEQAEAQRELTRLQILNTPAAQRFNSVIAAAVLPLTRVQAELGNRVLPSLSRLVNLTITKLPQLTPPLYRMVSGITAIGESFLTAMLGSQRFYNILDFISRSGIDGARIFANLGNILINVLQPMIPIAERFRQKLVELTAQAANWTGTARGMAAVRDVLLSMEQKMYQVFSAIGNLTVGFYGLYSAMDQAGLVNQVWGGFLRLTEQFRALTAEGTKSRGMVVDFFRAPQSVLTALWSLVGSLVTQWFRVANAVMTMRNEAGKLILPQALKDMEGALRVIGQLLIEAFRNFGPYIGPIIQGLAEFARYFIALNPVTLALTRSFAWLLEKFAGLSHETKIAIAGLISARLAFAIIGTTLAALFSPITRVVTGLGGIASSAALLISPVGLIAVAIGALAAGFVYAYRNSQRFRNIVNGVLVSLRDNAMPVIRQVARVVRDALGAAFRFVVRQGQRLYGWFLRAWPQIKAAVLPVLRQVAGGIRRGLAGAFRFVINQGQRLIGWFRKNWPQIRAAVAPVVRFVSRIVRNVLGAAFKFALNNARIVVRWFKQNWPLIQRTAQVVGQALLKVVRMNFRILKAIIWPIVKQIVSFWRRNWKQIENIVVAAWNIIKSIIRTAIRNVLNIIKLAMQVITGDWRGAWQTIRDIVRDSWNNIKTVIGNALRIIGNIVKIALNNLKALWDAALRKIRQWVGDWSTRIQNLFSGLASFAKNLWTRAWGGIRNTWANSLNKIRSWTSSWATNLKGIFWSLVKSAGRIFGNIKEVIAAPMRAAYNTVASIWNKLLDGISGVLEKLGMKDAAKKIDKSRLGKSQDPKNNEGRYRNTSNAPAKKFAKGGIARGGVLQKETQVGGEAGDEGLVPLTKVTPGGYQAMEAAAKMYGYKRQGRPKRGMSLDNIGHQDPYDASIYPARPLWKQSSDGPTRNFQGGGQHSGPYIYGDRVNSAGQVQVYKDGTSLGSAYDRGVKAWNAESTPIRHVMTSGQGIPIKDVRMGNTSWAARHLPLGDGSSVIQNNIDKGFTSSNANALAPHELGHPAGLAHGIAAPSIMNYGSMYSVGGLPQPNDYAALNKLWSGDKFKAGEKVGAAGDSSGGGNIISKWISSGAEALWGKLMKSTIDPAVEKMQSGNTLLGQMAGTLVKDNFAGAIEKFLSEKFGGSDNKKGGPISGDKAEVARQFADEAKKRGIPGELPVMTALVESNMENLSYGDRDSVGYFQQRTSQGWGSLKQLQDPAYALDAFLDVAEGLKGQYGSSAGELGNWAQAVQRSAFPDRYAQEYGRAQEMIAAGGKGKNAKIPGYTEGGMPTKPHQAMVEPHDLYLPLNNQKVMQTAQTALGTRELRQDNAMLRNELAGLRSDLVDFGIRISDMDDAPVAKMGKAAREGAKGHLGSRDGERQVNNISKRQTNRSTKTGGGR